MIRLHCRPPGLSATEVRIGGGVRGGLTQVASGRDVFALCDRAASEALPDTLPGDWPMLALEGGEGCKDLRHAEQVLRALVRAGLDRQGMLVVVGGGSLGDLGGLVASLFSRGIDLVQVPTTLLSMVDSAVGGKTAVNLPEGKNLAGTVHPARLVLADLDFLGSLPETEYRSGLGEVLKVAIGLDRELFELLEQRRDAVLSRDPQVLAEVVRHCVQAKIAVVEADPREQGRRRLLNLGHTLGHALEAWAGGTVPHGLAVARGLHFALEAAAARAAIGTDDARRARDLLQAYDYRRDPLPPAAELLPFVLRDKKRQGNAVHMALPTGIGSSDVQPVDRDELRKLLADQRGGS